MCQQLDFLRQHSILSENTCQQYYRMLERLRRKTKKPYRQISVDDITSFIASLPGSMKPQAFAAVKLLYGQILLPQMPEEFKKQWPTLGNISAKQRKRLPENAQKTEEDIFAIANAQAVDTRCLIISIYYGMRMSEALELRGDHVKETTIILPGRLWKIPGVLHENFGVLTGQYRGVKHIFPLTRAGYARRLRQLDVHVRQIRTAGIASAFTHGADADETWKQFGIFEGQQQTKYWKLYGNI